MHRSRRSAATILVDIYIDGYKRLRLGIILSFGAALHIHLKGLLQSLNFFEILDVHGGVVS